MSKAAKTLSSSVSRKSRRCVFIDLCMLCLFGPRGTKKCAGKHSHHACVTGVTRVRSPGVNNQSSQLQALIHSQFQALIHFIRLRQICKIAPPREHHRYLNCQHTHTRAHTSAQFLLNENVKCHTHIYVDTSIKPMRMCSLVVVDPVNAQ